MAFLIIPRQLGRRMGRHAGTGFPAVSEQREGREQMNVPRLDAQNAQTSLRKLGMSRETHNENRIKQIERMPNRYCRPSYLDAKRRQLTRTWFHPVDIMRNPCPFYVHRATTVAAAAIAILSINAC